MSRSHKHNVRDSNEKKSNQPPKSGSDRGTPKSAHPVKSQEFAEGSFTAISAGDDMNIPVAAVKGNAKLMSQPQQQQKPQPKPHPQQTEQSMHGTDGIKSN